MANSQTPESPLPESSLPKPLTPLVGRVWEVASAGALLRDPQVRLLTLTGPGGVGKTRLALRIAEQTESEFAQGVVFVSLSNVEDPESVVPAIAESLGVPSLGDQDLLRRLIGFLSERQLLLVVDNFEQVAEGVTGIAELLHGAPSIKVLTTSRVPLRISGEQEFPVDPLPLPQAGRGATPQSVTASDAGALFLQRARAVRPSFEVTDELAAPIAEICRRLDGLPLAIELAAARMKVLSVPSLLARLAHSMQILTEGPRDAPERLQTMRAAISWSYDLLSGDEQELLRRLSIFQGGFGLDAAAAVVDSASSDDVFAIVASLVDKSLLTQIESVTGDSRFMMLETIRDFGLDELHRHGGEDDARQRQANWIGALVEMARPSFSLRTHMRPWLDQLEEEHDNIRAVLDWQMDTGRGDEALHLCGGLYWFWYIRGYLSEGRARIEHGLEASTGSPPGDRARALLGAAMMAHWQGDDDHAEPWIREAIDLARDSGDEWASAFGLGLLGVVAEDCGRYQEAVEPFERALEIAEKHNYPATVALILDHLGVVAWGQGHSAVALEYWEKGLSIHREVGDQWGAAIALSYLGIAACERHDLKAAMTMQSESLAYRWEIRNTEDVAHGLSNLGMVAVAAGRPERAARLFGAAESTHELIGNPVKEPELSIYRRYIEQTRELLGDAAFQESWNTGRALSLEDAVAEAMEPVETTSAESARPFDLTARELDVLRLLAEGRSDREIGEMLFISTRTAQGHVSHILGKLGVSSRTAATNLALREGMAG